MIYIIILIVIVVIVAVVLFLNKMGIDAKKEQEEAVNAVKSRFSGKELSEREKRALAYGAVLAVTNLEDPISLMPDCGLSSHVQAMDEQWEINSKESAKAAIEELIEQTNSEYLDEYMASEENKQEVTEIYKMISEELNVPLEELEKVKSTYAWDIGRASVVSKWCFWIDYITEEELFEYLDCCVEIGSSKGNDWNDFIYSFLIGRCLHGFKLKHVIEDAKNLLDPNTTDKNAKIFQIITFK